MNRSTVALALLLLALAAPATVNAATRCVPASVAGCDSGHGTIAEAITAAANGDTVRIAAGTYAEQIVTDKRLDFIGAGGGTLASGAGTTTIAPPAGAAIQLGGGGSLRGLRAVGASGFSGNTALYFVPTVNGSYELDIADFVGIGGSGSDFLFGYGGHGAMVTSTDTGKTIDLSISNSQFQGGNSGGFSPGYGLYLSGAKLASAVSRARVVGPATAVGSGLFADHTTLTLEDSSVSAAMAAQLFDGAYTIRRSRIHGTPDATGYGIAVSTGDLIVDEPAYKLLFEDSLIVAEPGFAPIDAYGIRAFAQSSEPYKIDLRGSTVIGRGDDPDAAVAIIYTSGTPAPPTIDLRNSIARLEGEAETGEADLLAEHGSIVASSSAFSSTATSGSGTVAAVGSGANFAGDPQLDSAFAPLSTSPLIDRGDPSVAYQGELDVEATPRSQDGTGDCVAIPDIGAFELASRCPKPPADTTAPSVSKASLSRKRFTARKPVHEGRKRGAKLSYTLSEAARVTVAFERRAPGRRVKVAGRRRCVKPTKANAAKPRCTRHVAAGKLQRDGKAGANTLKLTGKVGRKTLKPGRYRLRLTAVDAAGLRSKPVALAFRVLRP